MADPLVLQLLFMALASSPDGVDGTALAKKIKTGDHKAFHRFFEHHHEELFRFLLSKGIRRETAEDLIQQAFIYIWEHRARIDPNKSLRAYLFSIGYTRMLNKIRDNKKFEDSSSEINAQTTASTPQENIQHQELLEAVQKAIAQMPEKRGMVFEMCFMQEFTYRETAEALGLSIKTIENHMGYAFKDLRAALEHYPINF